MIAADLRKRRLKPHGTWHLDEVYLKIDGRMVYLWRAVDAEGEVLDALVQSKRNKHAALKLMRKLLKKYTFVPERLVTDDLRSYNAAVHVLGIEHSHERGRWKNNGAENSNQPTRRRERKMQRFKSTGSAQKFLSTHVAVYNIFNVQRHLTSAKPITRFVLRLWTCGRRRSQRPDDFLRRRILVLAARRRDKALVGQDEACGGSPCINCSSASGSVALPQTMRCGPSAKHRPRGRGDSVRLGRERTLLNDVVRFAKDEPLCRFCCPKRRRQSRDTLGGDRPAEMKPLHFIAIVLPKEGDLILGFDPFGDDSSD